MARRRCSWAARRGPAAPGREGAPADAPDPHRQDEEDEHHQLVGILPGDGSTDEVIILNSHTDGMNAFQENGGIALVWLRLLRGWPRRAD